VNQMTFVRHTEVDLNTDDDFTYQRGIVSKLTFNQLSRLVPCFHKLKVTDDFETPSATEKHEN
jgi:hypothetical protein